MMEYFWRILASVLAGVDTGLVGLSAAAVTATAYIRHRNIDLRRGWIMLVCIIGMCTLGSFAARKAENAVLGGFTLLLTFCIGIRFLPCFFECDANGICRKK